MQIIYLTDGQITRSCKFIQVDQNTKPHTEVNYLWFLMPKGIPSPPFIIAMPLFVHPIFLFQECQEVCILISLYLNDIKRADICLISLNLLKRAGSKAPKEKVGIVQFVKN